MKSGVIIFVLACLQIIPLFAADRSYERELAEAIEFHSGRADDVVRLESDGQEFVSLISRTPRVPEQGAILLMHGLGQHPNVAGLVYSIQRQFPGWGWSVLSLQMPVFRPGFSDLQSVSLLEESRGRIQAGIDWIGGQDIGIRVLVGHGFGAVMAIDYLVSGDRDAVNGVVLVSLPRTANSPPILEIVSKMPHIALPVLDLFSAGDERSAPGLPDRRRLLMKKSKKFRQIRIEAAGKGFFNAEDIAVKRIYSWINRVSRDGEKGLSLREEP